MASEELAIEHVPSDSVQFGTRDLSRVSDGDILALTKTDWQKGTASNPFFAELGLLGQLMEPRVSAKKAKDSFPAPKPIKMGPSGKRQSVPPLRENEVAHGEVQNLPNYGKLNLAQSSTGHVGLKEMQMSRKLRHEEAVEVYKKRMVHHEVELEARTGQVARGFKQLMSLNDAELAAIFEELEDDFLRQMELVEVDDVWERVDQELKRREGWVGQFETDLNKVEVERRLRVEGELTQLMRVLVETAHLLPPQLERLAEEMTHEVNLLILSNREVHADLISRLRIHEIKRQKGEREGWCEKLSRWRRLRHDDMLVAFDNFMHSPPIVEPTRQRDLVLKLAAIQAEYQQGRLQAVCNLKHLKPPALTEAEAMSVRRTIEALCEEEAAKTAEVLGELSEAENELHSLVEHELDKATQRLRHFAAESDEVIAEQVGARLRPLVDQRREASLEAIERVQAAAAQQRGELQHGALQICSTYEAVGRLLDQHEAQLALIYEQLRHGLAVCREHHEATDKDLEDKLNACLLQLRRAADQSTLEARQQEALGLLKQIQIGYREFHTNSVNIAAEHPAKIVNELTELHRKLLTTLSVQPIEDYKRLLYLAEHPEEVLGTAQPPATVDEGGEGETGEGEEGEDTAPAAPEPEPEPEPEPNLWATFGVVYDPKGEAELALDDEYARIEAAKRVPVPVDPGLFKTAAGQEYQFVLEDELTALNAKVEAAVTAAREKAEAEAAAAAAAAAEAAASKGKKKGKQASPPQTPPVQAAAPVEVAAEPAEEGEKQPDQLEIRSPAYLSTPVLTHPVELTVELSVGLAIECLNYADVHQLKLPERARAEEVALNEVLTRELDERLMFHLPRPGHVETDIAYDRQAELLAHRERFVRHVKQVTARQDAMLSKLSDELRAAEAATSSHTEAISKLMRKLSNEKNSYAPSLKGIQREAHHEHEIFRNACTERFVKMQASARAMLQSVQSVNSAFRNSWTEFDAGGNFNEEEEQRFLARLQAVDARAQAEAEKQEEKLAQAQAEQLAKADAVLAEFNESFALNMEDVMFVEGLRHRQSAATAEVRMLLSKSSMQSSAIEERTKAIHEMLGAPKRRASQGEAKAEPKHHTEVDEQLPMKVLKEIDSLRKLLLERAKFLDVLQSTGIPSADIALSLDPPPKSEAANGATTTASTTSEPLMQGVLAVRTKHEANLVQHSRAYYDAKGDRQPTRLTLIPPTFEEHKQKLEDALSGLVKQADDDRIVAVKAFRVQLLEIEANVLNRLGSVVLEAVASRCRSSVSRATSKVEAAQKPLTADLMKKRELHRQALKPSLRNPKCQPELLALEQAEASRHAAALQEREQTRSTLLKLETDAAQTMLQRLVHLSERMLKLLDATVFEKDLVPANEPPEEIHYALKKKMRLEQRMADLALSGDTPAAGRPFSVHVWPGLPLHELTPVAAGVETAAPESSAETAVSPEISSNLTRSHRAVITARNKAYHAYKSHFLERVVEVAREADTALSDERQWKVVWDKLVESCKVDGS